jgi:hypothetical protein
MDSVVELVQTHTALFGGVAFVFFVALCSWFIALPPRRHH